MSILKFCNKSIKHFSYLLNKSSCDAIFIGLLKEVDAMV